MDSSRRLGLISAILFLVVLVADFVYRSWQLPVIASVHTGVGLGLPLVSRAHAAVGPFLAVIAALGLLVAVGTAMGLRGTQAPLVPLVLGLTASGLLAVTLVAIFVTQASMNGRVLDTLMEARAEAGLAQRGTMSLLTGDLARAEQELTSARNLRPHLAGGIGCITYPGYSALQLAEVRRAQGRVHEARQLYAEAVQESEGNACTTSGSPYSVASTARARLAAFGAPPAPAPTQPQGP